MAEVPEVLICPANYFYSDKVGSEVIWSIKILKRYSNHLAIFYESYMDDERDFGKNVKILGGEARFDGRLLVKSKINSLKYIFSSFFSNLGLLLDSRVKVLQHMLPYNPEVTFNLLILLSFNKKIVIGPVQSCPELSLKQKILLSPARLLAFLTLLRADTLICSDKASYEKMRGRFPNKRVVFISPGVDVRPKIALKSHEKIELLNIGQLVPRKNHLMLLKILKRVFEIRPDLKEKVRLTIFGRGKLEEAIYEKIYEFGLKEVVDIHSDFIPYRHKEKIFSGRDILINTSKFESFNTTALDALSFGLPLISTVVGGYDETIENKINGFKSDDFDALCRNLILLIDDNKLRKKMSQNNFEKARNYSWDIVSEKYYSEVRRFL